MPETVKRCINCGRVIPEDELICLQCGSENEMQTFRPRIITNGDRIRAMTDEQLCDFMAESICDRVDICKNDTPCQECRLEWLKKEAEP
ncbi:MAG: hypothetical protein J6P20_04975 [Oscillospiraceae bacterium]|nr:hypothetical protein [Oscillospiraceae bacterium]